jgi:hypothetical protein
MQGNEADERDAKDDDDALQQPAGDQDTHQPLGLAS